MYERLLQKRSTRRVYSKCQIVVDGGVAKMELADGKVAVFDSKFAANLKRHGKMKFLGYFDDKTEAAKAYDRAAIAHGGVYRLNFEE